MKEISMNQKVKVIKHFLNGLSYDEISQQVGIAKGSVVNIVNEFARTLEKELDYQLEAANSKRAAFNFASDSNICIPSIYDDFSTTRVLTTAFVDGIKVSDIERATQLIELRGCPVPVVIQREVSGQRTGIQVQHGTVKLCRRCRRVGIDVQRGIVRVQRRAERRVRIDVQRRAGIGLQVAGRCRSVEIDDRSIGGIDIIDQIERRIGYKAGTVGR